MAKSNLKRNVITALYIVALYAAVIILLVLSYLMNQQNNEMRDIENQLENINSQLTIIENKRKVSDDKD